MASHSLSPPPNAHQHPTASRDRDSRERSDFPSHQMMNMNGASGQPLRSPGE
jgi:hypothetical protein